MSGIGLWSETVGTGTDVLGIVYHLDNATTNALNETGEGAHLSGLYSRLCTITALDGKDNTTQHLKSFATNCRPSWVELTGSPYSRSGLMHLLGAKYHG